MLLSDRDIRAELDSGRVVLEPYDPAMIQPSSVDVRIDRLFRLFDNHKYSVIDPAQEQPDLTRLIEVDKGEAFVLHPGEFVLASTYEVVTLPDDVAARLEGKSSLGRLGLITHSTAGFIDPGFSGHVTLELANVAHAADQAVARHEDRASCASSGCRRRPSTRTAARSTGRATSGQRGPTASRSFLRFHQADVFG